MNGQVLNDLEDRLLDNKSMEDPKNVTQTVGDIFQQMVQIQIYNQIVFGY